MESAALQKFLADYGAQGVLIFLVLWVVYRVFPSFIETHKTALDKQSQEHKAEVIAVITNFKETIRDISTTFKGEQEQCREERLALASSSASERDKDRKDRASFIEVMGTMAQSLARMDKREEDHELDDSGDGNRGPQPQRRKSRRNNEAEGGT